MNIKSVLLLTGFSTACVAIALFIKPESEELSYVYEKSYKLKALKEEYQKQIKVDPKNLSLQKKYLKTLEVLNDEKHIPYAISFYEKTKDIKTANKIINYYKAKGNYEEAILWLDKLHKNNKNDKEVLNDLIKLTSYTKKLKKQSSYMIKKYEQTKETSLLFDILSIGEKEYSLEKLFTLAKEEKLNTQEYIQVLKNLIYAKYFNEAKTLYANKTFEELEFLKNKDEYIFLNEVKKDYQALKDIYHYLYKQNENKKYFEKLSFLYLNEGDIETYINLHENRYKKYKESSSLETLISHTYLNENMNKYIHYLEIQAIEDKDLKKIESIIAYHIDEDNTKQVFKILNKINNFSKDFDKYKKLSVQTYIYLNEKQKAKEILLSYKADELSNELIEASFSGKMNEETMPYYMKALSTSKNKELKDKLFRYRYKTLRLFTPQTYEYFGKPNTFRKLNEYIENFPKKKKNKHFYDFAKSSKDPMFIAEVASYFLRNNEYKRSEELSLLALDYYNENKLALKNIALSKLWTQKQKEALDYLEKLYELNKKDIDVNYYLAEIYFENKEFKKANKHYNFIVKNIEKDSLENKRVYLNSKIRLTDVFKVKDEFVALIEESNQDKYLIADLANHFFINRHYNQSLLILDKYQEVVNTNQNLLKLKAQIFIKKDRLDEAQEILSNLDKKDKGLYVLYQDLGYAYELKKDKKSALLAYGKSLKLNSKNEKLEALTIALKKDISHNINTSFGIRSKVKEASIEGVYKAENFHLKQRVDKYDDYYSPKLIITNKDESLALGAGKDYLEFQAKNILSSNINFEALKSIDKNSKNTISDELLYEKLGLSYNSSFDDKVYYSAKLEHFNYDKKDFERLRASISLYYPFYKEYFASLAYIYEDVKGSNAYGYDDLSNPIVSVGENNKFNKNISYLYSLGAEYSKNKVNPFANLNLEYSNRYLNTSLNNSVSRDYLSGKYNYTSMLNFSYYFID